MKYKVQIWKKTELLHEARGLKQAEDFFKRQEQYQNRGKSQREYFVHSIEPVEDK